MADHQRAKNIRSDCAIAEISKAKNTWIIVPLSCPLTPPPSMIVILPESRDLSDYLGDVLGISEHVSLTGPPPAPNAAPQSPRQATPPFLRRLPHQAEPRTAIMMMTMIAKRGQARSFPWKRADSQPDSDGVEWSARTRELHLGDVR